MNRWHNKFLLNVFKLFIFIALFFNKLFAVPPDSLNLKLGILPSVFFTPETNFGFGGLLYSNFKIGKADSVTRKSNTQTYLSYTVNKQISIESDYQLWLNKNNYLLIGKIDYSRFPQLYFGIGNNTSNGNKMNISLDAFKINLKNLKRFYKNCYLGVIFNYQNYFNQTSQLNNTDNMVPVYGHMGFCAAGIGPLLVIDKRNNPLNPSKGSYIEASYIDYKYIFNNHYKFIAFTVDARKYCTLLNKIIWNGNIYANFNKGEVPYKLLSEIGGARFLRGYYKGRFRDNNMVVIQNEFRMPVYKSIGVALFGGIGEVANTINQFKTNQVHYNYGVGLRLRINKKENTNIRIDYGFTKDSQGLYIVFAEAF